MYSSFILIQQFSKVYFFFFTHHTDRFPLRDGYVLLFGSNSQSLNAACALGGGT